jgi:hypothetical protein
MLEKAVDLKELEEVEEDMEHAQLAALPWFLLRCWQARETTMRVDYVLTLNLA